MFEGIFLFPSPDWNWIYWGWMVSNSLYCIFQITTISLYWYKVHSLRRDHSNQIEKDRRIRDRIQSILHRVLILTYFYVAVNGVMIISQYVATHAAAMGWIGFNPFWIWPYSINSLSISYSMFLMQDHNTSEYLVFLQFIKRYQCILCFCCFGSMVREQYRMLVENVEEGTVGKMVSAPTLRNNLSPTYRNNTTGMELSIATKTVIEEHSVRDSMVMTTDSFGIDWWWSRTVLYHQ